MENKELINQDLTSDSSQKGEATETEFDPIQAINELKQNTVSKEEYNKVKAEKDKYLKALIEGSQVADEKKEPVDVDALRKSLFTEDLDNLTFAKKALELRNELIDKEGVDIFVGRGNKYAPTQSDYEAAQRVADAFQSCVDVADGDSEIFTRELMRITNDVAPQININPKIRR